MRLGGKFTERYTHLNAELQIIVKAQTVKRLPAMQETQV